MRKGLLCVLFGIIVCFCVLLLPGSAETVLAQEQETYDFYQDGSGKNITADDAVEAAEPAPEGAGRMSLFAVVMSTSEDGITLLKQFEGCRLTAYKAVSTETYYTIGYGHFGPDVTKGMTITQAQADALLKQDLVKYETYVNNFLSQNAIAISQRQFDALVSLTYNCGNIWSAYDSFVLKTYLINGISKYSNLEIMNAFRSWKRSRGVILPGLVHRRMTEAAYFLDDETVSVYSKGIYHVDADTLNVRTGPATSNDKVATIAEGAELNITEINGYWGKYETGWVCLDYCTLTLVQATNSAIGVELKWKEVSDAIAYQIMRKDKEGKEELIATTTKNNYTDTTVKSGETYSYYIYSVKEDGAVDKNISDDKTAVITYISQPVLISVSNTSTGVKLKWKKSVGAVSYQVLRKTGSGSWKKLTLTTTNSYVDTTAVSGNTYTYSVRCTDSAGSTYTSSYDKTGLTIYCLARPVMSKLENKSTGIKVTWAQTAGAAGYYVYRQKGSGSWTKMKSTKSVSWTDKKATTNGQKYKYRVYAYWKGTDGKITQSAVSASKTIYRLKSTSIKSLTSVKYQKATVKFKKNAKASGYQIEYSRYASFKSSKKVKVTSASATLSKLAWKKKYYVRVRAYMKVGSKTYYSAWCTKKSVKITR